MWLINHCKVCRGVRSNPHGKTISSSHSVYLVAKDTHSIMARPENCEELSINTLYYQQAVRLFWNQDGTWV